MSRTSDQRGFWPLALVLVTLCVTACLVACWPPSPEQLFIAVVAPLGSAGYIWTHGRRSRIGGALRPDSESSSLEERGDE